MSEFSTKTFLEACGLAGPLDLKVEHTGAVQRYVLKQPFALIGRDPRADIRLTDGPVSRRHAYLQVLGGRLLFLDLSTRTDSPKGAYPHNNWLTFGQSLQVGDAAIRLASECVPAPAPALPHPLDILPPITLDISGGRARHAQYQAKLQLVLIGNASECQIRLRNGKVSRFHCALVNTSTGLWAVDLLGKNGITVNREATRAARLDVDDELRIGSFVIRALRDMTPVEHIQHDVCAKTPRPLPALPASNLAAPTAAAIATAESLLAASFVPAPHAGAGDESLSPLVQHLTRMQQHMVDQFRMTITQVVDAFRDVHHDQMQLIRQELLRVHQLSEELTSLKLKLAQASAARALPAAQATAPAAGPGMTRREAATPASTKKNSPVERPSPPPAPARSEANGARKAPAADRPPIQPVGPPMPPPANGDDYGWISRRIAEVQREQEGRWHKILSFLGGKSG